MSVADYNGRVFDILVMQGAAQYGDVQLQQQLFGPETAGQICTGIQKLAQAWVIEFLTSNGSMKFEPDRGTLFVPQLRAGRMRTEADVVSAFTFASIQIRQNFSRMVSPDIPTDEQLDFVRLDQIIISPDLLTLRVSIYSVAGDSRKVILPLDIIPTPLQ